MALTIANPEHQPNQPQVIGQNKVAQKKVTFDASYPTGGEAVTPASVGLTYIDYVRASPLSDYRISWDRTNSKLKVFWGDNNNASDSAGVEVADTTDLSGLVAYLEFVGV
jgi:hypothetical protein